MHPLTKRQCERTRRIYGRGYRGRARHWCSDGHGVGQGGCKGLRGSPERSSGRGGIGVGSLAGVAAQGSLSVPVGGGDLLARVAGTTEFTLFSKSETSRDIAILCGRRSSGSKTWVRAAAGLGVAYGLRRGRQLKGICWLGCSYEEERHSTVGLALQFDAVWAPLRSLGLGLSLFGNMNGPGSFGGATLALHMGQVRQRQSSGFGTVPRVGGATLSASDSTFVPPSGSISQVCKDTLTSPRIVMFCYARQCTAVGTLALLAACSGAPGAAPARPPAPVTSEATAVADADPTTADGIFTLAQADRGEDVYRTTCSDCHEPEDWTDGAFKERWEGESVFRFWYYINDRMPKRNPWSLSRQQVTDVLSYILELNGLPAGDTELAVDDDSIDDYWLTWVAHEF